MGRRGFTLVELLITIAIIGILSSMAVTRFIEVQRRAKRAEVPVNVSGIRTAEIAYAASYDEWVEQPQFWPEGEMQKHARPWPEGSAFDRLGWSPDGDVRGEYRVEASEDGRSFEVIGQCDVDNDEDEAMWRATETLKAYRITDDSIF